MSNSYFNFKFISSFPKLQAMQEDSLEELRKGFVEAIAAHKFIELKLGIDRSIEINKLKQQWRKIKQSFDYTPDCAQEKKYNISKYQILESHLFKLQQELESTKSQLLQQYQVIKNLIQQNSIALQQVQELKNCINTPPTLEFTTINDVDYSDI